MNKKILTIILGMFFLVGIGISFVSAENQLSNMEGINFSSNVISGSVFTANFSFDYLEIGDNSEPSPLIIKLNFSSNNNDFPVWKNDFEVEGTIEKYSWYLPRYLRKTIDFNCTEVAPYTLSHSIGKETISEIGNGTFYCYNEEGDLNLDEHDEISLRITSNIALWPGEYSLTAQAYYLNDTTSPIVIIENKSYFDQYFRDGSYVDFNVTINETNGLLDYNARISNSSPIISFSKEWVKDNIYHFYQILPNRNQLVEGDYLINVTAKDIVNNEGLDSVIIKIDNTPPEIELVEPTGIVSEEFTIKFNVTDEKAGVDNESIKARLREIINGQICPTTGGYLGDNETPCTTTSWIDLTLNETSSLFEADINTTEYNLTSNEYWLDATALDILGNKADWIANGN